MYSSSAGTRDRLTRVFPSSATILYYVPVGFVYSFYWRKSHSEAFECMPVVRSFVFINSCQKRKRYAGRVILRRDDAGCLTLRFTRLRFHLYATKTHLSRLIKAIGFCIFMRLTRIETMVFHMFLLYMTSFGRKIVKKRFLV